MSSKGVTSKLSMILKRSGSFIALEISSKLSTIALSKQRPSVSEMFTPGNISVLLLPDASLKSVNGKEAIISFKTGASESASQRSSKVGVPQP